jgi:hypothetical protein
MNRRSFFTAMTAVAGLCLTPLAALAGRSKTDQLQTGPLNVNYTDLPVGEIEDIQRFRKQMLTPLKLPAVMKLPRGWQKQIAEFRQCGHPLGLLFYYAHRQHSTLGPRVYMESIAWYPEFTMPEGWRVLDGDALMPHIAMGC